MKTKAVIFDKDGTLIDFDSFWLAVSHAAIKDILKELDCGNIPVGEILSEMGVNNGVTDINGVLCRGTYAQMSEKILAVLRRYKKDFPPEKVAQATTDAYHRNSDNGIIKPTCENIENVLSELKARGIKLAVVTTDDPFVTRKCLETLNIEHFFDSVYTDDGKLPVKPDPYCIKDFLKNAGISEAEAIMVGDTLTDVRFANNGGIRVVCVAKDENNRKILEKETDTVIPDISYLAGIIE